MQIAVKYIDTNIDEQGYPLCPKYRAPVMPNELDLCSLCANHSASVLLDNAGAEGQHWASVQEIIELDDLSWHKIQRR